MPIQHRVEQGETFASIAHEYGFTDWRAIYNHPENRSVRENRRSPFILLPGDNLVIPDKEPPEANRRTDARHRFVKKSPRLRIRLELKGLKGEALSNFPYRLDVEGQQLEGTTNADGGANWTYGTTVADPDKLAGIGMTYSALNRTWGDPRRFPNPLLPESDDAIDQAFDDRGIPIFTIYHEFGHLFLNTARRRADYSSQEAYQADVNVVQQIRADQELFDRYSASSGYSTGGGQSQGWGEGFAEAYRKWMQDIPLAGGQDGFDLGALLLRLGLPTHASVRSAISAIERSA